MKKFVVKTNEIGIDESGRGCLLGRVYAGAVIWPQNLESNLIKDSKKLSKKKRKKAVEWIKENIPNYAIGYATEKEIDELNILNASYLAMQRAIENLNIEPEYLLIDGNIWDNRKINNKNIDYSTIVKGDDKVYSIAAASILAKEYHDNYIKEICTDEINNKYDLLKNMGYGTKKHMDGIKKHGICDYHRLSFSPCK